MTKVDVVREVRELKSQLAYSKNIGFLFGAGTSCAVGIPGIEALTAGVVASLPEPSKQIVADVVADLGPGADRPVNVEDVLNQLRRIREITKEKADKTYQNVSGKAALDADRAVCKAIYSIITDKESHASLAITKRFLGWYSVLNRDQPKEIFTTNYDLVIEKSLEASEVPYFDGFVGSYEPFFWQDSVEHVSRSGDLTGNWIRLWKIHGSLSWFWRPNGTSGSHRIIRIGNIRSPESIENELVIYPSKDKYESSRKQPFVAYFDRLRSYLSRGELVFLVTGYSFSDEHVNEAIFNSLRQNNRLFVVAFLYRDEEVERLHKSCSAYINIHVFGPTVAIIGGELGEWEFAKDSAIAGEKRRPIGTRRPRV